MFHGAEVAVCSEIKTKHVNTVEEGGGGICQFLSFKPVGARKQ